MVDAYTKQMEKVFQSCQSTQLAVRGFYGEGTMAQGDFYQISNQVTLGKAETQILNEIREVIPQIITYERQAGNAMLKGLTTRMKVRDSFHSRPAGLTPAKMPRLPDGAP